MGVLDELAAHDADDAQRVADLKAALAAGVQLRDELDQARNDLAGEKAARSADATAAAAALAAMTAERDALLAAQPHPEPMGPAFGMSLADQSSGFTGGTKESAQQQKDRYVAKFGALPTAKCFYPGALPSRFNATYEGLVDGKRAYVCFKAYTVTALKSYLDSIPEGWEIVLIYFQEPDDEIWVKKTLTVEAFTNSTKEVRDTIHDHPAHADGRARVASCFMEFSVSPGVQYGKGRWQDAVVVPELDMLTWDWYTNTNPSSITSMKARVAALSAVNTRLGFGVDEWAVLEIGDRPVTWATGDLRAAYWAAAAETLRAAGCRDQVWFDLIGTTGDHRLIPGQAYSDPLIARLRSLMS